MDIVSRLYFDLIARDQGGSKALNDFTAASDRAHLGFSKLGNTLSSLGGPFSAISMYAGQLGDALDQSLGRAQKFGLALTATGVGLTAIAASDQQAQSQLRQAIDNTGASYGDYRKQINAAVKQQEDYGHTLNDTENALNALTTAFQDPTRALRVMGDVANIAAEKHISLAEAASIYVRASQGQVRALLSLGIHLDGVGAKTGQINRAMAELHDRLAGQAAAAVDTFTGRLKVMETRLHDQLATLGKYGPEVTAVGAALTLYASILQVKAARQIQDTLATEAETKAEVANAAARVATGEAATLQAAAIERAAIAQGGAALVAGRGGIGLLGGLTRGGLIVGGGLIATHLISNTVGGSAGSFLNNTGTGASIGAGVGSVIPGVGTVTGALVGGGVAAAGTGVSRLADALAPSNAMSKEIADLMAGGKGAANLAKLHQIAANQMRESGRVDATVTQEIKGLTVALGVSSTATKNDTTSINANTDAVTRNADQLLTWQKNQLSASQSQDALRQAVHNMATTVGQNSSNALKGNSDAALANRDALRGAVGAAESYLDSLRKRGTSADQVAQIELNLAKAIRKNATDTYGNADAVDHLLQQLGFLPGQIQAVINALGAAQGAWDATFGSTHFGLSDFTSAGNKKAGQDAGKKLADSIVAGYTPVVSSGVKSATNNAVKAATNAKQIEQSIISTFQGIKSQITSTFDISNLPQKIDLFGNAYGASRADVAAKQYVRKLEQWANLLGRLRKKLDPLAVDQLEQAGVAAIPVMQQILHDHEIGSLNRSYAAIDRISTRVAGAQTSIADAAQIHQLIEILQRAPDRTAERIAARLAHLDITVSVTEISKKQGHKVRVR